MDKIMAESSAAGYTTAHHLWLRKLLEKYHIMLAVFICLWWQLMVRCSVMVHMFILQLEIMLALNVQMTVCIVFSFWLTEKMFCPGCFSISRCSQVGGMVLGFLEPHRQPEREVLCFCALYCFRPLWASQASFCEEPVQDKYQWFWK